ncbi:MAG: hypothetical protein EHM30_08310, partial [Desulfobacteraceae bacterium]
MHLSIFSLTRTRRAGDGLLQRSRRGVPMFFNYMMMSMVALSALAAGVAAPEFEAVSYDGRKITLSTLQQHGPVLL